MSQAPFAGFWNWQAEMDRLQQWPRMNDAFLGRSLEGVDTTVGQTWQDDMAAAQEALDAGRK